MEAREGSGKRDERGEGKRRKEFHALFTRERLISSPTSRARGTVEDFLLLQRSRVDLRVLCLQRTLTRLVRQAGEALGFGQAGLQDRHSTTDKEFSASGRGFFRKYEGCNAPQAAGARSRVAKKRKFQRLRNMDREAFFLTFFENVHRLPFYSRFLSLFFPPWFSIPLILFHSISPYADSQPTALVGGGGGEKGVL